MPMNEQAMWGFFCLMLSLVALFLLMDILLEPPSDED